MKKGFFILILAALLLSASACSLLPGSEELTKAAIEGIEGDFDPDDFPDITEEDVINAPTIDTITQKTLAEANVKEIQAIFAKNFREEFRTTFQISPDRALTEEDWLDLRGILYFQIFNTFTYMDESGKTISLIDTTEEKKPIQNILDKQKNDEEIAKTIRSEIEDMSTEEFLEQIVEITKEDLELNDEEAAQYLGTLKTLSKEEIDTLKEQFIAYRIENAKES